MITSVMTKSKVWDSKSAMASSPLPGLDLYIRASVAIDLPRDVIDAAGKGRRRLGEPEDLGALAFAPIALPALGGGGCATSILHFDCLAEPLVIVRELVDDASRPILPLGAQLGGIS